MKKCGLLGEAGQKYASGFSLGNNLSSFVRSFIKRRDLHSSSQASNSAGIRLPKAALLEAPQSLGDVVTSDVEHA